MRLESELAALVLSPIEGLGAGMSMLTWALSVALLERPVRFSTPLDELEEC